MAYTKDSSVSFPSQTTGKFWTSPSAEPAGTQSVRVVVLNRSRTGDRLPNWRELLMQGKDATTALTGTWESLDYTPNRHYLQIWRRDDIPATCWKKLDGDVIINNFVKQIFNEAPTVDTSFVDNLARASFYKKVHSLTRKFQGLVFLGELQEALHMLRRPAQGLQSLAKDFLGHAGKRKRANPKKWAKDLGGLWLENAFGWQPLINDCKDAVSAWNAVTQKREPTVRISSGSQKLYDTTSLLNSNERPGAYQTNVNDSQLQFRVVYALSRETVIVRYRGAVTTQVEAPVWQNAALFGFRPLEFVPAAWELLPWSFLVDYFTNIGDLLDAAVTSDFQTSYVVKSVIRKREKFRTLELEPSYRGGVSAAQWYTLSTSNPGRVSSVFSRKDISRTKQSGVAMPSFQFNFSLSDGQLGNCAALLSQANALHPQDAPKHWRK
jgi:hypothetical protein